MRWQRCGYARIDNYQPHPRVPRHHADGCPGPQEVQHHLGGNFLRVPRDSLGDHPVVPGRHHDRFPPYDRALGPLHRCHL